MPTRQTNLRTEVIKADPEWNRDRLIVPEYEMSNGRVFKANYTKRGAYAPEEPQE